MSVRSSPTPTWCRENGGSAEWDIQKPDLIPRRRRQRPAGRGSGEAQPNPVSLNDDEVLHHRRTSPSGSERHAGCRRTPSGRSPATATHIVRIRPITTLHRVGKPVPETHEVLLQDLPSSWRASGVVRVLKDPQDGARLQDGGGLVAQMTNPDRLPTMRRASALVTDTGGMTRRAAIVARELACPASSAARTADQGPWRRCRRRRRRHPTDGCWPAGSRTGAEDRRRADRAGGHSDRGRFG